jgi:hypothetical protein
VSATLDDAQPGALVAHGTDLFWLSRGAGGTTLRRKPEGRPPVTIATQALGDYAETSLAVAPPFVFAALNSGAGGVLVRARLDDVTGSGEAVATLPSGFSDIVTGPSGELFLATPTGIARFDAVTQALTTAFTGLGAPVALRRSGNSLFFVSTATEQLLKLSLGAGTVSVLLDGCSATRSLAVSNRSVYLARAGSVVRLRF